MLAMLSAVCCVLWCLQPTPLSCASGWSAHAWQLLSSVQQRKQVIDLAGMRPLCRTAWMSRAAVLQLLVGLADAVTWLVANC